MDLSFLKDALSFLSQSLTYPVIALLLAAVVYALFSIGSLLVELFIERRHFNVAIPQFLHAMEDASVSEMPDVIKGSGMLLRQKAALLTLFQNRDLQQEALWALAKKLLTQESEHYQNVVARNEMLAKLSPMIGLMGTLIPLGPGLAALGSGEIEGLSEALIVAFDTTVAGLLAAAVCMVVARIRRAWYSGYGYALEAAVTTMLEKIDSFDASDCVVDRKAISENELTDNIASKKSREAKVDANAQTTPLTAGSQPEADEAMGSEAL